MSFVTRACCSYQIMNVQESDAKNATLQLKAKKPRLKKARRREAQQKAAVTEKEKRRAERVQQQQVFRCISFCLKSIFNYFFSRLQSQKHQA